MVRTKIVFLLLTLCIHHRSVLAAGKNDCPRIKLKRQWGGKGAREVNYQVLPIDYVIIHHTVTSGCTKFEECAEILQNMQNYHMNQLDYDDIGYNFMIGDDGIAYEGRGWGVVGAHTYGYNRNSTGIAFIGNFNKKPPTRAAVAAAQKLLVCGVKSGDLTKNYRLIGASQVSDTKSPGLSLFNIIQEWNHWVLNP